MVTMRKNLKVMGLLGVALTLVISMFSMSVTKVYADEGNNNDNDEMVIDEMWGEPVYVYGDKLSEDDAKKLADEMGYNFDELDSYSVDGEDMVNFLGEGNPDSNMYSSVIIEREEEGYGIEVEIPNEDRITKINESQYENAMTTSGVSDAKVIVDSPEKVTGESALTGIFKAYDEKEESLDEDRMKLGQEELEVSNDINEESEDDEDYNEEDLNAAITDIKQELSELDDGATKEDVEEVVDKALEDRDLDNTVSDENKEKLVVFADNYRNSDAIDSEEVKQQLEDISGKVADKAKDFKKQLDDSGFWKKLGDLLKDFVNAIKSLFN